MIDRLYQLLLITSTACFAWLAMMVVHESGHVLNAWLSHGIVSHVVLHPLMFSRTDLAVNPHPLFVAWGGAIWGCLIPLILLMIFHFCAWQYKYLVSFWAGFCCIANGAYLMGGAFFHGNVPSADDAGVILQNGGSFRHLILFGLITIPLGLFLWNGLGTYFGLGTTKGKVDRKPAVGIMAALFILVLCELVLAK